MINDGRTVLGLTATSNRTRRPKVRALGLAILLALVFPSASPVDAAPVSGWLVPALLETDNDGAADVPQVAVDGLGNSFVVWQQSDGTRNNIWANRYQPGIGWGTAERLETANGDATKPDVAADGNGYAIAVWQQSDGVRDNIWKSRYVPGEGWTGRSLLETLDAGGADAAQIAMNAAGTAFVVWRQGDAVTINTTSSRYTVAGGWETPQAIETTSNYTFEPHIAVNPTGVAFATWGDGPAEAWANRYLPGTGWGTPAMLTQNFNGGLRDLPSIAVDPSGNALAAWVSNLAAGSPLNVSRYTNGSGWSGATQLTFGTFDEYNPVVGMDANGNGIVVWMGYNTTHAWVPSSARYVPGTGWGPVQVLNPITLQYQFPQVAVNANGEAVAVWTWRAPPEQSEHDIYHSRYVPGSGWQAAALLETTNGGRAYSPQVAIDSAGNASVTWKQSDGTRDNIWATRYVKPDTTPPSVTITYPDDGSTLDYSPITVTGTTEPGATVSINGIQATVESDGTFAIPLALPYGPSRIIVTATDSWGNSATAQVRIEFADPVIAALLDLSSQISQLQLSTSAQDAALAAALAAQGVNLTNMIAAQNASLLAALAAQNASLTAFIAATNSALLAQLAAQNATLLANIAGTNTSLLAQLASQNASLQARINSTNASLLSALALQNASLLAQLSAQNASLLASIASTNASLLASLAAQSAALTAQIAATNTSLLAALAALNASLTAQIAATNGTALLASMAALNATLTAQIASTNSSLLAALAAQNASLTSQIGATNTSLLAALAAQNSALTTQIAVTNSSLLAALAAQSSALTAQIAATNSSLMAALAAQNLSLLNQIAATNSSLLASLAAQNLSLQNLIALTNASLLGQLAAQNTSLTARIAATNASLLAALASQNTNLLGQIAATNASLLAALAALDSSLLGQLAALNSSLLASIATSNAQVRAELAATNASLLADLAAQDAVLRSELAATNASLLASLAAQNDELLAAIAFGDATLLAQLVSANTSLWARLTADGGALWSAINGSLVAASAANQGQNATIAAAQADAAESQAQAEAAMTAANSAQSAATTGMMVGLAGIAVGAFGLVMAMRAARTARPRPSEPAMPPSEPPR